MNGLWTGIRPVYISPISKMVSDYSGMMVQPHKVCVYGMWICGVCGYSLSDKSTHKRNTLHSLSLIHTQIAYTYA